MTLRQAEQAAYAEIVRRYKALGIAKRPRPAGLGSALAPRHQAQARRYLRELAKT